MTSKDFKILILILRLRCNNILREILLKILTIIMKKNDSKDDTLLKTDLIKIMEYYVLSFI